MNARHLPFVVFLFAALGSPAHGFNFFAHRVIADIAWQKLDEPTRGKIVATLRRHPRFEDFEKAKSETVQDEDRWIFPYAAVWPDTARGLPRDEQRKYNNPSWHYVNFPIVLDGKPAPEFNLADGDPKGIERIKWNVLQAIAYNRGVLESDASPQEKALAYCWLFHLVGDAHQTLHSSSLVCERFNGGDRGGNLIPTVQNDNLHALWDGFLGRRESMSAVASEVEDLRRIEDAWEVDLDAPPATWSADGFAHCKSTVYSPEILDAVEAPGELAPIKLSDEYLRAGGKLSRRRGRWAAAGQDSQPTVKVTPRMTARGDIFTWRPRRTRVSQATTFPARHSSLMPINYIKMQGFLGRSRYGTG